MRFINIVCLVAIATITGCAPSIIKTRDVFPESKCPGMTDAGEFNQCIESAMHNRAVQLADASDGRTACSDLYAEVPRGVLLPTGIHPLVLYNCSGDYELTEYSNALMRKKSEEERAAEAEAYEAEQQAREAAAAEKEQAMTEARQAAYRVIPIETAQLTVIDVIRQYRRGDFAGLVKRIDRCWASAKADKDMMMCGMIGMTAAVSHEVYKVRNRPLALSPEFVMTDMRKRLISKGKARNDEQAEAYMDAKIRPFADLILVTVMQ